MEEENFFDNQNFFYTHYGSYNNPTFDETEDEEQGLSLSHLKMIKKKLIGKTSRDCSICMNKYHKSKNLYR